MRPSRLLLFLIAALLITAAPASAAVPHTVQPGETLWSIAAANNLTTRTVASFNGLSEDAQVVLGSTIMVPTTVEGYASLQQSGAGGVDPCRGARRRARARRRAVRRRLHGPGRRHAELARRPLRRLGADAGRPQRARSRRAAHRRLLSQPRRRRVGSGRGERSGRRRRPAPQGAYKVRAGDTLGNLAAQEGVSAQAMAAMNGLDPNGVLLEGTVIKLPSGAPAPAGASTPAPAKTIVPNAAPAATPGRVSAADVQSIAALHGVSPSLAAAIAWQESGFNNGMVSGANARGVMQVMPGTWDYVQQNLAGSQQLDPSSATDNVHAGVMYLKRLLDDSGGDENAAIAGYYQGLSSVRNRGMFDDTQQYVNNVQALRSRFGG